MKNAIDHIMFLAFRAALLYSNKRSLTLQELHDFRINIVEKHKKIFSQYTSFDPEELEYELQEFYQEHLKMDNEEEILNFRRVIEENEDVFTYSDGKIILKDNVTLKMIDKRKFELESYKNDFAQSTILLSCSYDMSCLSVVGGEKIKAFLTEMIADERLTEQAYYNYQDPSSQKMIEQLITKNNFRLSLVANLNEDKMSAYHMMLRRWIHTEDDKKDEDIDLLSDYLIYNYKFYELHEDAIYSTLYWNQFHRAIFNVGTLIYAKLEQKWLDLWSFKQPDATPEFEPVAPDAFAERFDERMQELDAYEDEYELDDDGDEDIDCDDEYDEEDEFSMAEWEAYKKRVAKMFYLSVIKVFDDYQEFMGENESLNLAKTRIIYLLDDGEKLYNSANLEEAINKISLEDIDYKGDYYDQFVMCKLFLIDILEGWILDEFTLKKLLFVIAYYDLTKDYRIRRLVNRYKETEMGMNIKSIIFKHDYEQLNLLNSKSQSLIRKKKDKKIDN